MESNNIINLDNTIEESVLIVDKDDNPMGSAARREMRKNRLCHRSSAIFIQKGDKFLIQKRAMKKEYYPGFYDLSSGGIFSETEEPLEVSIFFL